MTGHGRCAVHQETFFLHNTCKINYYWLDANSIQGIIDFVHDAINGQMGTKRDTFNVNDIHMSLKSSCSALFAQVTLDGTSRVSCKLLKTTPSPMEDISFFIRFCPTISIQVGNLMFLFSDCDGDFQIMCSVWITIFIVGTILLTGSRRGTKQCEQRLSPIHCPLKQKMWKNSPGPPSDNIEKRPHHTVGVIAMMIVLSISREFVALFYIYKMKQETATRCR